MIVEKFALVKINRKTGPEIDKQIGFSEDDNQNILLYSLPTGEAVNGSYKFIQLGNYFYCSLIQLGSDDDASASIIAVELSKLTFNPFDLCPILEEMLKDQELSDPLDDEKMAELNVLRKHILIQGITHVIGSLFLLERVIIVGKHEEVIDFMATIYEGIPARFLPQLSCLSFSMSLHDSINLQGVPHDEELADDLEKAQKNSTIVLLEPRRAFGLYHTPFTDDIENLYLAEDFEGSKNRIEQFLSLIEATIIASSGDFANEHNISRADAKLLKNFQERVNEVQEERASNPFYRGVL